jgi:hypothetical protein
MAKDRSKSGSPADTLTVEAKSTLHFLGDNTRFLYIPAYQRPFAWTAKGDIGRLFNDVAESVVQLSSGDDDEASAFLGALILVNDTKRDQIHPSVRSHLPQGIHIVIDGQQRCTTILIWACALLAAIDSRERKLRRLVGGEDDSVWGGLLELVDSTQNSLAGMVFGRKGTGAKLHIHYPKLIRSHEDQWSTREADAKYESPVARLLWAVTTWHVLGRAKKFKYGLDEIADFKLIAVPPDQRPNHEMVAKAYRVLHGQCEDFATAAAVPHALDLSPLLRDKGLQEISLGAELESRVIKGLCSSSPEAEDARQQGQELIRLILLANYLMNRVCLTIVTTDRDDRAFDMFDALNTTGQPLTAFETFRPLVIEKVGLKDYRGSREFGLLEEIDALFRDGDKSKRTEKFVIHAALLQQGKKLPKRLSRQREWLKDYYSSRKSRADQEAVLSSFRALSRMELAFSGELPELKLLPPDSQLALRTLSEANHDIVVPLLCRFFKPVVDAPGASECEAARMQFGLACKSIAAFALLWRLAKGGTAKIDDAFRRLMEGVAFETGGRSLGPFCMSPVSGETRSADVRLLSDDLISLLREQGGLDDVDRWVAAVRDRPSYQTADKFVRLLLAAAMHDSVVDEQRPGLLKAGNAGTHLMLDVNARWCVDNFSIEHVAPQSKSSDWSSDVYDSPDRVHCIGNLTLLPQSVNSAIQNRAWAIKRATFELMIEKDPVSAQKTYSEIVASDGLQSFPKLEQISLAGQYYPHLLASAAVEIWNADFIKSRSENLCRLGHARLMKWLKCH